MATNPENDPLQEEENTDELPILTAADLEERRRGAADDTEGTDQHPAIIRDLSADQKIILLQSELAERDAQIQAMDAELEQAWVAVVQLNRRWTDVEPQLHEREQNVAALKDELLAAGDLRQRLEHDITAREGRIADLEKALETEATRVQSLEEQQVALEELRGVNALQSEKLATLEHYIDNRHQHWEEREAALGANQQRIKELEHELLERVRRIEQVKNRVRKAESKIGVLAQQLVEADLAAKSQEDLARVANDHSAKLEAEIVQWREHSETLRSELSDQNRQLKDLGQALEQRDRELSKQAKREKKAAKESEKLESDLRLANEHLGKAEEQLQDGDQQIKNLHGQLTKAEATRADLEHQLMESKDQIADLQAHLARANEELASTTGQHGDQQNQIGDLTKQLELLKAERAEMEQRLADDALGTAELDGRLVKLREEHAAAEQKLAEQDRQIQDLTDTLAQAEGGRGILEKQCGDQEEQLLELKNALETVQEEKAAISEQLADRDEALRELQTAAEADRQREKDSAGTVESLQGEIEDLRIAADGAAAALATAESRMKQLAQALADQERELVEARDRADHAEAASEDSQRTAQHADAATAEHLERISDLEEQLSASGEMADELLRLKKKVESADARAGTAEQKQQELVDGLEEERRRAEEVQARCEGLINEVTALEATRQRRELLIEQLESQLRDKDSQLNKRERKARLTAIEDSVQHLDTRMSKYTRHVLDENVDSEARVLVGTQKGREIRYPIYNDAFSIGRTPDNDIQIPTSYVSRHHARVIREGEDTYIEDLRSTNGVYVNSQRVTKERLKEGDEVTIGRSVFLYRKIRRRASLSAHAAENDHSTQK